MRISDWSSDVCSSDLAGHQGPRALAGAASATSFCPLPCEGGGGLGRGAFWIIPNRGHPLPASPCLRRGRGQVKSPRPKPLLQVLRRPWRILTCPAGAAPPAAAGTAPWSPAAAPRDRKSVV